MIHLILREPIAYQKTLYSVLSEHYNGAVTAWFHERSSLDRSFDPRLDRLRFLSETGYRQLWRELRQDSEPVVILGSWSSEIAYKTLLIVLILRVPVFIWADHPHPVKRRLAKDLMRKVYLRVLSRLVAGFLACGRPTASELATLGIDPHKITVFPYWVDLPGRWSLPNAASVSESAVFRLVAIGRLVAVKQFEVAIKAVFLANAKAPQRSIELILVGDGADRPLLERAAASYGCQEAVKFCGWLDGDDLSSQITSADALVLTSKFDAYGVVVLEAMAHGRPVLASDGVVAALDRDDRSGAIILHPAGDADSLAKQIAMLASDHDRVRRASFAARSIAEEWKPERAVLILDGLLKQCPGQWARSKSKTAAVSEVITSDTTFIAGQ
jgi:glycosyltransferase involved in cell wall biosynthesis